MLTVSNAFINAVKSKNRLFDSRIKLNGTLTDDLRVLEFQIEEQMGDSDDVSIGLFSSKELTIKLKTDVQEGYVAIGDSIEVEIRAFDYVNNVWTDWVSMGIFYIDSAPSIRDKVMTVIAYDKAIFADILFTTNTVFPITMQAFFDEINAICGFTLDTSVSIDPTYMVNYYNNTEPYSCRELIGYIAGAHGANARISRDEKLVFKKLSNDEGTVDTISVNHMYDYQQLNPVRKITNVVFTNETTSFESGSTLKSETMYGFNPLMTQQIADDILTIVNGYSYVPLKMNWTVFPWLETGDKITVEKFTGTTWINNTREWQLETEIWDGIEVVDAYGGSPRSFPESDWQDTTTQWIETYRTWNGIDVVSSVVLHSIITFSGGLRGVMTNNGLSAQETEYRVDSLLDRKVRGLSNTAVKTIERYYGVQINSDVGIQIDESNLEARAVFNADKLALEVGDGLGFYTPALNFDTLTKKYKFVGDVDVEGSIVVTGGSIDGQYMVIGSIDANKLNVTELSAISADIGTVTAGDIIGVTITGGTFRTSPSGERIQISNDDFRTYNSLNQLDGVQILSGNYGEINFYTNGVQQSNIADLSGTLIIDAGSNIILNTSGDISLSPTGMATYNGWEIATILDIPNLIAGNGIDISGGETIIFDPSEVAGTGISGDVQGDINLDLNYTDDRYCRNESANEMSFQEFSDNLEVFQNGVLTHFIEMIPV